MIFPKKCIEKGCSRKQFKDGLCKPHILLRTLNQYESEKNKIRSNSI